MSKEKTEENIPLSKRIFEVDFKTVKSFDVFNQSKAYKADEVDDFLSNIGRDVENMETQFKRLFQKYKIQNDKMLSEEKTSVSKGVTTDQQPDLVSNQSSQKFTSNDTISKMQQHMSELLIMAEEKAESVKLNAQLEAERILEEAQNNAANVISNAQEKASQIEKQSEEKMQNIISAKKEIEDRSKEVKLELETKAREVEEMGITFGEMGKSLRKIVNEKGSKTA